MLTAFRLRWVPYGSLRAICAYRCPVSALGAGRRHSPPIRFGDGSFVLTTEAARDDYFEALSPDSLPAAVHVAAAVCGAGSVLFDVGANVGLCALPFSIIATETGRVVAVEPGRRAAADLRAAVQLNERANIEVIEAALSHAEGEATLLVRESNASGAFISCETSLASAVHEASSDVEAVHVRVVTLDDLVEERGSDRVDLIKIDVEGFESRVLAGSTRTLARFRPVCVIELNPFTLSVMANENPVQFLADLQQTFPFVTAVDGQLNSEPVVGDSAAFSLVARCYVRGQVCDLICAGMTTAAYSAGRTSSSFRARCSEGLVGGPLWPRSRSRSLEPSDATELGYGPQRAVARHGLSTIGAREGLPRQRLLSICRGRRCPAPAEAFAVPTCDGDRDPRARDAWAIECPAPAVDERASRPHHWNRRPGRLLPCGVAPRARIRGCGNGATHQRARQPHSDREPPASRVDGSGRRAGGRRCAS